MGTRTFTLGTTVPVDAATAIDFVGDLERHVGLHPFLVSATVTATGTGTTGPWRDYVVVERPRAGRLRYTVRFTARVVRTSPTSLHTQVRALPGCRLLTDTVADDGQGPSTRLTETCTVTAPRLLLGYVTRQARIAHARAFQLLPGHLTPG